MNIGALACVAVLLGGCSLSSSTSPTGSTTQANIRAIDAEVCSTSTTAQIALGSSSAIETWTIQLPGSTSTTTGTSLTYTYPTTTYLSGTPGTSVSEYAIVGNAQAATASNPLTAGNYYTLAFYGECSPPSGSTLGPTLAQFQDNYPTSIPSGQAAVRVINLAPSTNTLYAQYDIDVSGTAVSGLNNVAYGTVSNGGTYTLVTANGSSLGFQLYSHASGASGTLVSSTVLASTSASGLAGFTPASGGAYTIFIIGSPDAANGTLYAVYQQDVK
jgi:hypothetical protein